ncbi:MAG: hypothetical protein QOD26_3203 [Betaproteobacteria bacterium]|nr:hypothetical protein [Betaproteobacteria bacterium]
MEVMRPSASQAVDCPLAQPSRQNTYARTMHRACVILGGVPALAGHLKVSETALRSWMNGIDEPPLDVFLATVEILLLHSDNAGRA